MNVLFDHQIFDFQRFGGVSRYFFELISHFEADAAINWELPIAYSDNEYLKHMPAFKDVLMPKSTKADYYKKFMGGAEFKGKTFLYRVKNKLAPDFQPEKESEVNKERSIEKLKEGNFDIFHPTYYDDYFLDYIGDKPYVLTVYDLIHQIFPEFGMYEKIDKNKRLLDQASKVIAISESTKIDLMNLYGLEEAKIAVTHLANSMVETHAPISASFKSKVPAQYILFVGGRGAYKNFLFFAHVFASLVDEYKDLQIVCTGSPFAQSEIYLFEKIGISDRVHNIYVNDDQLAYLYKEATAFIFPSMYEGFGLPVLEAFSCGCPVLLSRSSSLIEVGEEAAVYFEPKNPGSMKSAIKQILDNKGLRTEMIKRGYEQLRKFSWEETGIATGRIYAECINIGGH